MTNKAYIVANEQQEHEVLEKLEREGYLWRNGEKPTKWLLLLMVRFPYALINDGEVSCKYLPRLTGEEIVFDGRKEEKMSEKYVVSHEFMKGLEDWKEILRLDNVLFIGCRALSNLPTLLDKWWRDGSVSVHESNNRLIAIIRWVNGEDVFEVEKPKKWVVRSRDSSEADRHLYVRLDISYKVKDTTTLWGISNATRFDTKEEAESWANSHQEVIEVEE